MSENKVFPHTLLITYFSITTQADHINYGSNKYEQIKKHYNLHHYRQQYLPTS